MTNIYERCCISKCALPFCDNTETGYNLSKSQKQTKEKRAADSPQVSETFLNGEVQGLQSCRCSGLIWPTVSCIGLKLSLTRLSCSSSRWFCSDSSLMARLLSRSASRSCTWCVSSSPCRCCTSVSSSATRSSHSPSRLSRRRRSSCFSCSRSWKRKKSIIHRYWGNHWFTKVNRYSSFSLRHLVAYKLVI